MNKGFIFALIVLAIAVAGGFFYFSEQKAPIEVKKEEIIPPKPVVVEKKEEPVVEEEPEEVVEEKKEVEPIKDIEIEEDDKLAKAFEDTLNALLKDVNDKFEAYKKDRKLVVSFVDEKNLRDPAVVEKNAKLMTEKTASLREKTFEVLAVFDKANADIEVLLSDKSDKAKEDLLEKWAALVKQHVGSYSFFFNREDDALKAHARLMRFYFTKRNSFEFDPEKNKLVFKNPRDQEYARKLRVQVNRLSRSQELLLNR